MRVKSLVIGICTGAFLSLGLAGISFAQSDYENAPGEQVRQPVQQAVEIRQQTQEEREQWQELRQELTKKYDQLQDKNQRLAEKQNRLQQEVHRVQELIAGQKKQLADIQEITQDVEPFLKQQLQRMQELVSLGLPFLTQERELRLNDLQQVLAEEQEPVSEKYRRIMEAFWVEAEYGRTIEVYQERIQVHGRSLRANIFRLGRLSLFYQTVDQQESGWFNVAADEWETLPARYNRALAKAIDIGSERRPVQLLTLPLGRMVVP